MTPIDKLLPRLEGVKERGPNKWKARCPSHDDRTPSLMIEELPDGKLLVSCMAHCPTPEALGAVGLSMADLFPDGGTGYTKGGRHRQRWTVKEVCNLMSDELAVVMVVTHDVERGRPVSKEDVERVIQARRRLQRIREIGRV